MNGIQIENMLKGLMVAATIVLIMYSPIARAIGQRILHGRLPPPGAPAEDGRVEELSGEVAALRHHLEEAQERIDFTERMLAQSRREERAAGREGDLMEGVLAVIFIFGGGTLFLLAVSPVGRAFADRLRGHSAQPQIAPEELDDVRAQLQSVQEQLSELAERQDFTERMLSKTKDQTAIGPAKEAS